MKQQDYELGKSDQRMVELLLEGLRDYGQLVEMDFSTGMAKMTAGGSPVPGADVESKAGVIVLPSRRFAMDNNGRIWTFFAENSPKDPDSPKATGPPWRGDMVEMWNGKWMPCMGPDGQPTYKKKLCIVCVNRRVNGTPGMTNLRMYQEQKGYKHPLDPPHSPTAVQKRVMTRGNDAMDVSIYAKLEQEGIDAAKAMTPAPLPEISKHDVPATEPKKRSNRRVSASAR